MPRNPKRRQRGVRNTTRNSSGIVNYLPPQVNPNANLITTVTTNQQVNGSGAGTGIAAVIDITRTLFPELAGNMLGLYNYARIIGGRLWYKFSVGVAGADSTSTCGAAVGFDTHQSGSGLTVPNIMQCTYHSKPMQLYTLTATPTVCTQDFQCLSYKCPVKSIPVNAGDPLGGSWFLIDSGSTPNFHNVQFCCDGSGGSGVNNVTWFVELDIELSTRL